MPTGDPARGQLRGLLFGDAGGVPYVDSTQTALAVQPGFDSPPVVAADDPEGERRRGTRMPAEVDQGEARRVSAIKAVQLVAVSLRAAEAVRFPASIRFRRYVVIGNRHR